MFTLFLAIGLPIGSHSIHIQSQADHVREEFQPLERVHPSGEGQDGYLVGHAANILQ